AAATGGAAENEVGGILTIDLDALRANYRKLAARVVPGECAAVVKADAYGCGIEPVTAALLRAGCKTLFVAHPADARRVRAAAPAPAFTEINARPVIGNSVELCEWDHFVSTSGWGGEAALHVDTGMNRLGLSIEEAAAVAARIQTSRHGIALLMSHLACADQ